MRKWLAALAVVVMLGGGGVAAPLFPDVPDAHWARDAVAALATKGLVEGYPDGTFKGDRAASRWEVAMVVARLLAKMEQAHATFATKAELEELRKLADALREELDALGVRVTNLEEATSRLDKRVTELERITFYGSFDFRGAAHSYTNQGVTLSDPTDALLNYNDLVGTVAGAGGALPGIPAANGVRFDPNVFGVFTVNNLKNGRPLVSGTGYSAKAILGLRITVNDDIDAGAEFAAYTTQGDQLLDLYYGVSAPYLSNGFTAISTVTGGLAGVQPLNHRPFTRMTLDNFWLHHKPSDTRLRLGAYSDIGFDPIVFQQMYNPALFGPKYLDNFGFQVKGRVPFGEDESSQLQWEVMGTLLPDRNGGVGGAGYYNHAEGLSLGYLFHEERGEARFNFLRAANDASGGAARAVGLISAANFSPTPWVNPAGFFFNQLGGPNLATAGIGSTSDIRPVPMPALNNDGITGVAGTANYGNVGPQDQTSYGVSFRYEFELSEDGPRPRVLAEWAHSDYQPQKNSGYSVDGDAYRGGAGVSLFEDALDLEVEYVSVDPTYDPFVLQIPRVGGILFNGLRLGENFLTNRGDLYFLHDTEVFPHNREGFRGKLDWRFSDDGQVVLKGGSMDQKQTSLQDVRFSAGALGAGIPNTPVLGFSPGFVDAVFGGFSPFTFAEQPGVNAFATPLENPSGSYDFVTFAAQHKWWFDEDRTRGVRLHGTVTNSNYFRDSNLQAIRGGSVAGTRGENENYVDLGYLGWEIGVDYDVTEDFTALAGYGVYSIAGHYDPYGTYSNYAETTGLTRFDTFDIEQSQPFVGFDWAISDALTWNLDARLVQTNDRISQAVFASPSFPALNLQYVPQRTTHPFDWDGIQINTAFSVSF